MDKSTVQSSHFYAWAKPKLQNWETKRFEEAIVEFVGNIRVGQNPRDQIPPNATKEYRQDYKVFVHKVIEQYTDEQLDLFNNEKISKEELTKRLDCTAYLKMLS